MSAADRPASEPDWDKLLRFAGERRPDLIELKLILEADATAAASRRPNQALPQLDATALYRWNGLTGETAADGHAVLDRPRAVHRLVGGGNVLGPARACGRGGPGSASRTCIILRDRANLEQGLHAAAHDLATTVRGLESSYQQYQAFLKTRAAAAERNLSVPARRASGTGGRIFLNVLQAITDWGTAISVRGPGADRLQRRCWRPWSGRRARSWRRTGWCSSRSGSRRSARCATRTSCATTRGT